MCFINDIKATPYNDFTDSTPAAWVWTCVSSFQSSTPAGVDWLIPFEFSYLWLPPWKLKQHAAAASALCVYYANELLCGENFACESTPLICILEGARPRRENSAQCWLSDGVLVLYYRNGRWLVVRNVACGVRHSLVGRCKSPPKKRLLKPNRWTTRISRAGLCRLH